MVRISMRRGVPALLVAAAAAVSSVAVALGGGGSAGADTSGRITFESYSAGSLYGQQGWSGLKGGCGATYDTGVVANNSLAPYAFGAKSLRMSNAVTTGCFGDQLFSPKLVNEAGEARARATSTGGVRQSTFSAQWTVASATRAAQPGLFTSISPDNGQGARMSYVSQLYKNGQLYFNFVDVKGLDPSVPPSSASYPSTNFRDHFIGPFNPAVPHTVRLVVRFLPGKSNDVARVYVDGLLRAQGTSWEDYYDLDREAGGAGPSAVNCLIFRESGTAHPELAGKGFLFDNITTTSSLPNAIVTISGSASGTFTVGP